MTVYKKFKNLIENEAIKDFMVFAPRNAITIEDFLIPSNKDAYILDLRDGHIEVV